MPTAYDLHKLAEKHLKVSLIGDGTINIHAPAAIEDATSGTVSFIANPKYASMLKTTGASLICITEELAATLTPELKTKTFLVSADPSLTFQKIAEHLLPETTITSGFHGIDSRATVHPTAKIGKDVHIAPGAVIDQLTEIGDGTRIGANVSIGPGVKIGKNCILHPNVVVRERSLIGNHVILQPGVVIGSCGFGYTTNAQGVHVKLDQIGIVRIEDDVEIGAGTTVDRARFHETVIGKGTKIDNLVQIGHNVHLGPYNLIVAQVGIAGSVKTGRHVVIGGQAGVVGHLEIADGVMLAARSGVRKSLTDKGGAYAGAPALPAKKHHELTAKLNRFDKYTNKLDDLLTRLETLENNQ